MRTLIADDQPDVLEALRLLLKNEGYRIEAVHSPSAVIESLKTQRYDLLLMDLNYARDTTSGEEGLDLLARIQAIDSTLPVVAMTAWGTIDLAVELMRCGVRDFVTKPWENKRLIETLRHQIELGQARRTQLRIQEEEIEDARKIERALLPKNIPQPAGCEISTDWRPARTLSGDYFDVLKLSERKTALCIADVIGKGMPAALLMANVQANVRAHVGGGATNAIEPREFSERLNRDVCANTAPGKFVTFFYSVLDTESKKLVYTNAGHIAPILLRRNDQVARLEQGGAVLGVFREWEYEQGEIHLSSGDRLLLFTDGVTDVMNANEVEFGEERLIRLALANSHLSATDLQETIIRAVDGFSAGSAQDDATLIVLSVA